MESRWWGSAWASAREVTRRWREHDATLLAAGMAYYAALSFFPLALILIAVLGFVLQFSSEARDAQNELLRFLAENTSPTLADHVQVALAGIRTQAVLGGPLGFLALLFSAAGIFRQLDAAFERIWNVQHTPARSMLHSLWVLVRYRLRAFLIMLTVGLLVVVVFAVGIAVSALREYAVALPGGATLWGATHAVAAVSINSFLFGLLYRGLPKIKVHWHDALRGGFAAALLWEIVRQLLATFVVGRKYSAYGVVGSLLILMLWLYVASNVLLLGAELAAMLGKRRETRDAGREVSGQGSQTER